MRVHHIANDVGLENGGAQRIVLQLHEGLIARGVASHVVALCGLTAGIPSAVSLGNESPYGWFSFWSVVRYIRTECSLEDVIHVHLFPSLLYVSLAVKLLRWKGQLVCTEHSTHNGRRTRRYGKWIDRLIYPAYDRIYCISQGTKAALEAWFPQQRDKMTVIENGASLPYKTFRAREEKKRVSIVSVGRLSQPKNYPAVLEALALLPDLDFDYQIAGIGEEEDRLKALCDRLGLADRVTFCGYVENVAGFLEAADIFLIPSLWEGFGLAAVEAMNAGLPVVASDVVGMKEIFDTPEPCGLLVSPERPDEIARAIRMLFDRERRSQIGRNAFGRSLAYSKEKMVKTYQRAYEQLSTS